MRRPERIPLFLDKIDGHVSVVLRDIYGLERDLDVELSCEDIYHNWDEIKAYWSDNPDLRFTQVLISLELIPNIDGFWYYIEEDEVLEKLGFRPQSYLLWGQYFDKDMNRLPEPIWRPIQDLDTDHILAILNGKYTKSKQYIDAFKRTLGSRGLVYDDSEGEG